MGGDSVKNNDVELFNESVLKDALSQVDNGTRQQYESLDNEQKDILNKALRLQAIRIVDIIADAVQYLDADIDSIRFEHESPRLVRLYAKNPKHSISDTGEETGGPPEMFIGQCEHWFEEDEEGNNKLARIGIKTISFRPFAKQKEETRYYTV
jgi:hypothetical protein